MFSSCGTTPMARRAARMLVTMSWPQTRASPAVLFTKPANTLMKVDLPAPLGPNRPKNEPLGMLSEISRKASMGGWRELPL